MATMMPPPTDRQDGTPPHAPCMCSACELVTDRFTDHDLQIVAARSADTSAHFECRKRLAAAWSAFLGLALDDHLEDGTPLLSLVLALNPSLARRLSAALSNSHAKQADA